MSMRFTPESVIGFGELLHDMQRSTGRDMTTIIRNVGRDFIRAAIRLTPIAGRRRVMRLITLQHRHTRQPVTFRIAPRSVAIRTRGFAKPGWITALRGLQMTPTQGIHTMAQRGGAHAARFGDFRSNLRSERPFVELANQVPYIAELDRGTTHRPPAHILARSMLMVTVKMQQALTRMSQRMARRWR